MTMLRKLHIGSLRSVVGNLLGHPTTGQCFSRVGSAVNRLTLAIVMVLSAVTRLTLPILVVLKLCFMVNGKLRQDYIYHASLPTLDQRSSLPQFLESAAERSHWSSFVKHERAGHFQNVSRDGLALVFSAYLDDMKNSKKIRAIGVKQRAYVINVTCVVWYALPGHAGNEAAREFGHMTVSGYVTEHMENFERSWAAVHYMCNLGDLPTNPYAVSILVGGGESSSHSPPLNLVPVRYTADDEPHTYTVCLHNAFNFRSDVTTEIVEWVETQRVLGADHFMIYNYSSTPENDKVLRWYESQGLVTIIQWDLPIYADLIFIGQVAVMTDCLYRNFYRSTFTSHLDLDEYIVPRRPGVTTVPELVSALPNRCGYITRCAVFPIADGYTDAQFEGKKVADNYKINTLLTRKRLTKIWKSKDRSKQLLRTSCVEVAGVHQVDGYTSIVSEMTFDPEDALLHHYRKGKPRFVKLDNIGSPKLADTMGDDVMLPHATNILSNVTFTWNAIESFDRSETKAILG